MVKVRWGEVEEGNMGRVERAASFTRLTPVLVAAALGWANGGCDLGVGGGLVKRGQQLRRVGVHPCD